MNNTPLQVVMQVADSSHSGEEFPESAVNRIGLPPDGSSEDSRSLQAIGTARRNNASDHNNQPSETRINDHTKAHKNQSRFRSFARLFRNLWSVHKSETRNVNSISESAANGNSDYKRFRNNNTLDDETRSYDSRSLSYIIDDTNLEMSSTWSQSNCNRVSDLVQLSQNEVWTSNGDMRVPSSRLTASRHGRSNVRELSSGLDGSDSHLRVPTPSSAVPRLPPIAHMQSKSWLQDTTRHANPMAVYPVCDVVVRIIVQFSEFTCILIVYLSHYCSPSPLTVLFQCSCCEIVEGIAYQNKNLFYYSPKRKTF